MEENIIGKQEKKQISEPKKQKDSKKAMNGMQGGIACAFLSGLIARGIYQFYQYTFGKILFWSIIFLTVIFFMVAISCFFDWKAAKKSERMEEESRNEEKEFSEIDQNERVLRSEKMFKMNQKELMRYYNMNLSQVKFLSALGIMMIISGILIVLVSLSLYVYLDSDRTLLLVGNISGIVVDFVGAIFIKMYTQNVEAAVKFHTKFAESNNLLLANSIANKIENEELREVTLSEISKGIVISKQSK